MTREAYLHFFPGTVDYRKALNLQERLVEERMRGNIPDTLLLLQHPKTITYGTEFVDGERKVLEGRVISDSVLKEMEFDVVPVQRKGKATLHDVGQLVAYAIIDLVGAEMKPSRYVQLLGEVLVELLGEYGFNPYAAQDVDHPGVFIHRDGQKDKKIAAIGIQIKKGDNGERVTLHGAALNINTDLKGYDAITPCGDERPHLTSMGEITQKQYDIGAIASRFAAKFAEKFHLQYVERLPQKHEDLFALT